MNCKNHPDVPPVANCCGCAEPFCGNCLVEIGGQSYCGSCKVLALKGKTPSIESLMRPSSDAKQALIFSILGLLIFSVILGIVSISRGVKAKGLIEADPKLLGSGQANAAIIIGVLDLVFFVLGIISKAH